MLNLCLTSTDLNYHNSIIIFQQSWDKCWGHPPSRSRHPPSGANLLGPELDGWRPWSWRLRSSWQEKYEKNMEKYGNMEDSTRSTSTIKYLYRWIEWENLAGKHVTGRFSFHRFPMKDKDVLCIVHIKCWDNRDDASNAEPLATWPWMPPDHWILMDTDWVQKGWTSLFNICSTFQEISRDFNSATAQHGTLNIPSFLKPSSKISEYSMTLLPQLFAHRFHPKQQPHPQWHHFGPRQPQPPHGPLAVGLQTWNLQIPRLSYPQCLTQYSIIHQNSIPVVSKTWNPQSSHDVHHFFLTQKIHPKLPLVWNYPTFCRATGCYGIVPSEDLQFCQGLVGPQRFGVAAILQALIVVFDGTHIVTLKQGSLWKNIPSGNLT